MKAARLIALLTIAAACMAQAEPNIVSSANIVGYVQINLPPGAKYQLVGLNFEGSTNKSVTLTDLFSTNQLIRNNVYANADKVHIYIPGSGYLSFYQRTTGEFRINGGTSATNYTLFSGNSFWLQSANNSTQTNTLYLSGSVPLGTSTNLYYPVGFRLFSNPYATDLNINDLNWTNAGATAHNVYANADKISLYDGQSYTTYYLRLSDGKWRVNGGSAPATNAIIRVGGGAWYESKNAFNFGFVKPYSL